MGNKLRKFADDGWALWIDGDERSTIYLNEWINPKGKSYVDVSVRIYGAKKVKSLNIYAPFIVSEDEFSDLSYMLSDEQALMALFNTNGVADTEKNRYTTELRYDGRVLSLINLSMDFIKINKIAGGTIITVDFDFISDCVTANEAYVIFRIPHKTIDSIFGASINMMGMFDKTKGLIQSPILHEKYGYSIRINEARLLPPELNKIEILQQQRIRKALVTISISEEYDMNDSTCYRIRRLEAELNSNYAPDGYNCENAITYQWVEERDANMKAHYNFYFTMERSKISKTSMLLYLSVVLITATAGGAIYDIIKHIIF